VFFLLLIVTQAIQSHGQTPTWIWASGAETVDQSGFYGPWGVPDALSHPSARESSASWTDAKGNLWLMGGFELDQLCSCETSVIDDLWEYTPSTGVWTWLRGKTDNQAGVYGVIGKAASIYYPGAREYPNAWTDKAGNLWLFGGVGFDATGSYGQLNDLWEYKPSSNSWTWQGGSNTAAALGNFGSKGVAAKTNQPGSRGGAISWTDAAGNFWLFGGNGYALENVLGNLNDLWEYMPTTGEWIWQGGGTTVNQAGDYGVKGKASASNWPGNRVLGAGWADGDENLWLFGGYGESGSGGSKNDLWKYSIVSGQWTWVNGSSSEGATTVFGTEGVAAATNQPGARSMSVSWIDSKGTLWLFGGYGPDTSNSTSSTENEYLNQFWEFAPSTGMWTWKGGSAYGNHSGAYGALDISAPGNMPGARAQPIAWQTSDGSLWLFGGYGFDSEGNEDLLNDLWFYGRAAGTRQFIHVNPVTGPQTALSTAGLSASANSGLPVSFATETPTICTVSESGGVWSASLLIRGICHLTATQSGNSTYAAVSVPVLFKVVGAQQSINLSGPTGSTNIDDTVQFGGTATSGLPVSFTVGKQNVCSISQLGGQWSAKLLSGGVCNIAAYQYGNDVYAEAGPALLSFFVYHHGQGITIAPVTGRVLVGDIVPLTATATSGLAPDFSSRLSPDVCSISYVAGIWKATLNQAGFCKVQAYQWGDSYYAPTGPAEMDFFVHGDAQTVNFTPITGSHPIGDSVPLEATATSGLPVNFFSANPTVCTVTNNAGSWSALMIAHGQCRVAADQPGNGTFASAPAIFQTFPVVR
jgi:N-acetylneuraminic acid mutarotase